MPPLRRGRAVPTRNGSLRLLRFEKDCDLVTVKAIRLRRELAFNHPLVDKPHHGQNFSDYLEVSITDAVDGLVPSADLAIDLVKHVIVCLHVQEQLGLRQDRFVRHYC